MERDLLKRAAAFFAKETETRRASTGFAWLLEKIKSVHTVNPGVYGVRRVHAELRLADGIEVGLNRVARLMRQAGISGLVRKKRGRTTDPRSGRPRR